MRRIANRESARRVRSRRQDLLADMALKVCAKSGSKHGLIGSRAAGGSAADQIGLVEGRAAELAWQHPVAVTVWHLLRAWIPCHHSPCILSCAGGPC